MIGEGVCLLLFVHLMCSLNYAFLSLFLGYDVLLNHLLAISPFV